MYLRRYHDIQISHSGVWRVLKRLGLNRLPASQRYKRHERRWKRYEKPLPGHCVQIDVKFTEPLPGAKPDDLETVAATAYARVLGQKRERFGDVPVEGGTAPLSETPDEVKAAQGQLKLLQWAIPALTGTALAMSARLGEQQRPKEVTGGILGRLLPGS
jgi:hypothetical protein